MATEFNGELLASVGSETSPIHVRKVDLNGTEYVDIRRMYTSNGELAPTKKGIYINTEVLADVIYAMTEVLDVVELEELRDALNERLGDDGDETADDYEDTDFEDDDAELEEDIDDEQSDEDE